MFGKVAQYTGQAITKFFKFIWRVYWDVGQQIAKEKRVIHLGKQAMSKSIKRDVSLYVPHATGATERSVTEYIDQNSVVLEWNTPYANIIYGGIAHGKKLVFSHDHNPYATDHWFEVAKSKYKGIWVKDTAAVISSSWNGIVIR